MNNRIEFKTEAEAKKVCAEVNRTSKNMKFCPVIRDQCKGRECMAWVEAHYWEYCKKFLYVDCYCKSPLVSGEITASVDQ